MSTSQVGPERPQSTKADHKAAKAYAKAMRPWCVKSRWWAVGLLLIIGIASAGCGADSDNSGSNVSQNTKSEAAHEESTAAEKPAAAKKPEMTSGQKRALQSAEQYLDLTGMSKAGLIEQLSSPAGAGFSKSDATYAAGHVEADFKKEAVESAKSYLDISPMSKDALFEQLTSSAGGKFTPAQARYAVGKVY